MSTTLISNVISLSTFVDKLCLPQQDFDLNYRKLIQIIFARIISIYLRGKRWVSIVETDELNVLAIRLFAINCKVMRESFFCDIVMNNLVIYWSKSTKNNIILDETNQAKHKYMTNKLAKFNKYKHKKSIWITQRLLASIRHRCKLYKQINKS